VVVGPAGYTAAFAAVGPEACIVAAAAEPVECMFSVAVAAVVVAEPVEYTFSVAVAAVAAAGPVEYTYVVAAAVVAEAFEAE